MSSLPRRLVPLTAILLAILVATLIAAPPAVQENEMPHLIHEYEAWAVLTVVLSCLAGAGVLIRRALRR